MFYLLPDEPMAEYHANPAISRSDIDMFIEDPKKFYHCHILGEKRTSTASDYIYRKDQYFDIGSALHIRLGEGSEKFNELYIRKPEDIALNTRAGAAWKKDHQAGRIIVKDDIHDDIERMSASVESDPILNSLVELSQPEVTFRGVVERLNLQCRPDLLLLDLQDKVLADFLGVELGDNIIVDIKTTSNLAGFDYSVKRYHYYRQAAFYQYLAGHAGYPIKKFLFLVIEKSLPFSVRLIELGPETLKKGYVELMTALNQLRVFFDDPEAAISKSIQLETLDIEEFPFI